MSKFRTIRFFLLSLLLHLATIGLASVLLRPRPVSGPAHSISFRLREEPPSPSDDSRTRMKSLPEPDNRAAVEEAPAPDASHRSMVLDPIADFDTLFSQSRWAEDSASVFNQDAWKQNILDFLKREKLLGVAGSSEPDSNRLVFTLGDFTIPPAARDDIADRLNRQAGGGKTFSATELIARLAKNVVSKEVPTRFDFLPSRVQVASLAYLYENREATQMDLYSSVDEHATTAEHLNRNLEHLVNKGWLRKKKISPENIFSFFGVPIEMSRRNTRNPLYIYEPRVDRSTLINYLQARLYLLKEQNQMPADSLRTGPRIRSLQKQIQALIPR